MLGLMLGLACRLLRLWFFTIGLVALFSGPFECAELTSVVIRKFAKLVFWLGLRRLFYQALNMTLTYELQDPPRAEFIL